MNAGRLVLVAAFATAALGGWIALRAVAPGEGGASAAAHRTSAAPRELSALAARAIGPRASVAAPTLAAEHPSLLADFVNATSYRALYDRLKGSAEGQTPEGEYIVYEILRKCATVPDRPYFYGRNAKPASERREEFVASLLPNDPQRAKRIAAFESVAIKPCAGFEGVTSTQADLNRMLADAAARGDPKARAASVEQEIWQERRSGHWRTASLSDTQIETLRQAIGSRDPEAMVLAGRLLSNSWSDLTVQVGEDGEPVEPRAFYNAWQILACQYGYPCGEGNPRVLTECAYNGHCDAVSLPDYLYYYGSSPYESRLLAQYQSVLRTAIESGDWSGIVFARGTRPATGAGHFIFAPSPH